MHRLPDRGRDPQTAAKAGCKLARIWKANFFSDNLQRHIARDQCFGEINPEIFHKSRRRSADGL